MSADDLTADRLQRWARRLQQAGLTTPTLMLLELSKPLSGSASHYATSIGLFVPTAGRSLLADLARLVDDPATAQMFSAALSNEDNAPQP